MSRKLSAFEVKVTLASIAHLPPDDVDGYVILLSRDADVIRIVSNAAVEATVIALLARAIEQRAAAVGAIETAHESCP